MKASELNVVVINDFSNVTGGAAKVAIDTAIGLSQQHVRVHYFCAVGAIDPSLAAAPLASITHLLDKEILHYKNKIKALFKGLWNRQAAFEMERLLSGLDKSTTIIHVHGWVKGLSISPVAVALKQGFNTVITLHDFFIYCPNGGFYLFPQKQICHKTPLSFSCISANCDSRNYAFKIYRVARTFFQRILLSPYKKKINLIALSELSDSVLKPYTRKFKATYFVENPIDTSLYPRVEAAHNSSCVFIGRLSSEKGVVYFCEALKLLNIQHGIVIGEGDNKADLIEKYPDVKFIGWKNKEQIKEILKSCRFLVFPSVWYETYGLVVQEASSYGIPCIVSDCTAACELVNDGIDGLIFRAKDVAHLATCMQKLYEDDTRLASLSQAAYNKFWGKDHSIKRYAGELIRTYAAILEEA